eukprot:3819465-Pyramimonas_sp.AAC.2
MCPTCATTGSENGEARAALAKRRSAGGAAFCKVMWCPACFASAWPKPMNTPGDDIPRVASAMSNGQLGKATRSTTTPQNATPHPLLESIARLPQ